MDDLFTTLLVKTFSGIMYVIYWITFRLLRISWWLGLYLILSLGAGAAWLARGGHGRKGDAGGFGHLLDNESGWQDAESGTVYPVLSGNREYCTIQAELAGQYWRRTTLNRLLRRGALWRYTFYALSGTAPLNRSTAAAWEDFPQEAWKNVTLDDIDPQSPRVPEMPADALRYNHDEATAALDHIKWLLRERGWKPAEIPPGEADRHWYTSCYERPVIAWDAPIVPAISPAQAAEQPSGQQ